MLESLLEHGCNWLRALGMPLLCFYHVLGSNIFLNVAAEDATGLEWAANVTLSPVHYFLEGKKAIPDEKLGYRFEQRFDYKHHFFVKTAASVVALPLSITVGGGLKALAFISCDTRERHSALTAAKLSTKVLPNLDYYQSVGLEINDFEEAPLIDSPLHKRRPGEGEKLQPDIEALGHIVKILHAAQIPFWLDCGSCLGTYRYGGAIPWDWDIDIAVFAKDSNNVKQALNALDPEKYQVQDWSGRDRPGSWIKIFINESQNMIDIYHFGLDPEKKELFTIFSGEDNIFFPISWKIRERRYTVPMPFSRVFPLKRGYFEGIEVPVPGDIEAYLRTFYGENLAPVKVYNEITQQYEKDLEHPYWQQPHAH